MVGTGYNSSVFFRDETAEAVRDSDQFRVLFAGKLSEKKGVYSLLRSLHHLKAPQGMEVYLAGGCGTEAELEKLKMMVEENPSYFYNIMPYALF